MFHTFCSLVKAPLCCCLAPNEKSQVVDFQLIDVDFNSLLLEWGEACQESPLTAFMSTSLMAGALSGSFIAGWLADTYGRLPVLKGRSSVF